MTGRTRGDAAAPGGDHLAALDGLRGIAAAIVVIGHSAYLFYDSVPVAAPWQRLMRAAAHSAHPSVILFFVLSGFVLYLAFARRDAPYGEFLIRRFTRIYPAMLVVFVAVIVARSIGPPGYQLDLGHWTNANLVVPLDAMLVVRNVLLVGTRAADSALDPVIWSLAIEMRFSVVFPLLARLCRRSPWALIALSVAAYIGARLMIDALALPAPYLYGRSAWGTVAVTLFYLPCFGFGIVAAHGHLAIRAAGRRVPVLAVTLAAVALLVAAKLRTDDFIYAISFALLLLAACEKGVVRAIARTHGALFLGRVSYSLYLVHLPILVAMVYALRGDMPIAAIVVVAPLVSLGVAVAMYRFVELPGITVGKRLSARFTPARLPSQPCEPVKRSA